jgi:hypothetical protein
MAIVRYGHDGSDVYLYESPDEVIVCHGDGYSTADAGALTRHLAGHRAAGQHVPEWVDGAATAAAEAIVHGDGEGTDMTERRSVAPREDDR